MQNISFRIKKKKKRRSQRPRRLRLLPPTAPAHIVQPPNALRQPVLRPPTPKSQATTEDPPPSASPLLRRSCSSTLDRERGRERVQPCLSRYLQYHTVYTTRTNDSISSRVDPTRRVHCVRDTSAAPSAIHSKLPSTMYFNT